MDKFNFSLDDILRYFVSGIFVWFCLWLTDFNKFHDIIFVEDSILPFFIVVCTGVVVFTIYRITVAPIILFIKDHGILVGWPKINTTIRVELTNEFPDCKKMFFKGYCWLQIFQQNWKSSRYTEMIWHSIRNKYFKDDYKQIQSMASSCHLMYQLSAISTSFILINLILAIGDNPQFHFKNLSLNGSKVNLLPLIILAVLTLIIGYLTDKRTEEYEIALYHSKIPSAEIRLHVDKINSKNRV